MPRCRLGLGEQRVGASVSWGEAHEARLGARDRARGPHPAKERPPGLVRDEHRERREKARRMQEDLRRVFSREPGDDGQEAVPERERVSGMKASVLELDDAVQRQIVEGKELADAGEVEEPVALNRPGDVPEDHAHDHPGYACPPASGRSPGSARRPAPAREHRRQGGEPGDGEESDRGRERGDQQKSDDKRSEEERERPGQRRGDAPYSERPGEAPARREQERNRERESEVQLQSVHRRVSRR